MTEPLVAIDKKSKTPVYRQIYAQIREKISSGALQPGILLPSIRSLSAEIGAARNTVNDAYRQLQLEGFIVSRRGSGFKVVSLPEMKEDMPAYPAPTAKRPYANDLACRYDFRYGNMSSALFPIEDWRRLTDMVLSGGYERDLVTYPNPWGIPELREQIARYLNRERGMTCDAPQVVVTSGIQQSISLIMSIFDSNEDTVAIEDPGFYQARYAFARAGFQMEPVHSEGPAARYLSDISHSQARVIYTTPSHQFPMGTCMGIDTRIRLAELAQRHDALILEDNYDSEFRYDVQPVPSLQSIDTHERVVYLGTFSKLLSPALHIGYMVLPRKLVDVYHEAWKGHFSTVPYLEQQVLALYMERGLWDKHVRRMVRSARKRHDLLLTTLEKTFGESVQTYATEAGLFVLAKVKNGMASEDLVESAKTVGVNITATRDFWLDGGLCPDEMVMFGYTAADEQAIVEGIPLLRDAWFPSTKQLQRGE